MLFVDTNSGKVAGDEQTDVGDVGEVYRLIRRY